MKDKCNKHKYENKELINIIKVHRKIKQGADYWWKKIIEVIKVVGLVMFAGYDEEKFKLVRR